MVRILSDSTCDLSKELVERYGITIIPLNILMGDKEYKDGADISQEQIFAWADANKTTPKTSAVSYDVAEKIMKPFLDNGDELIIFTISEDMSTTANMCRMVAEDLGAAEKVSVINSMNLSTGIGLLVIEAAILAAEQKSRGEICERIKSLIPKVRASFVVDTLVYLHRGGRCSGLAALLGSAIKLHPRIVVEGGKMHSDRKYRGKMNSVVLSYAKDLEEDMRNAKTDRVFITHTCTTAEPVESVRTYLESLGIFAEILETKAGGVISSHCGPGTLGVLFIGN